MVTAKNYLDVYIYESWSSNTIPVRMRVFALCGRRGPLSRQVFEPGQQFVPSSIMMTESKTVAPPVRHSRSARVAMRAHCVAAVADGSGPHRRDGQGGHWVPACRAAAAPVVRSRVRGAPAAARTPPSRSTSPPFRIGYGARLRALAPGRTWAAQKYAEVRDRFFHPTPLGIALVLAVRRRDQHV